MSAEDRKRALRIAQMKARQDAARAQGGKTTGQSIKEFFLGDDDPTTQNAGEKIGSFLNKAGEAMTFGLVGDEASAAVESLAPGVNYDDRLNHYRQQERNLERDHPLASLGAEIGGGIAGLALPGASIGTLARSAPMAAKIAASGAAGGGMGGLYGFMEGEGTQGRMEDAIQGAKIGGAVGGAVPVVGAAIQRVLDNRAGKRAIIDAARGAPTTEDLLAKGRELYRRVDDANVQIKPEAFSSTREKIIDALRAKTGFDELPGPGSLTPNSARTMQIMGDASERMAQEPTAALPFRALDQMRRQAGAAAGNVANKTDQSAGMEIIGGLDDFVRNMRPDDVVSGDIEAVQRLLPEARKTWSNMTRSQIIDDAIEAGNSAYLSGGASGIRNQFRSLLKNKKTKGMFSDAERVAMARVVNGTLPEQMLHLAGGGLGRLMQVGVGGFGGLGGAAVGAATGALARKASDAVANKNAEIVRALIANGGMKSLPKASDTTRKIIETLVRRIGAEGHQ